MKTGVIEGISNKFTKIIGVSDNKRTSWNIPSRLFMHELGKKNGLIHHNNQFKNINTLAQVMAEISQASDFC